MSSTGIAPAGTAEEHPQVVATDRRQKDSAKTRTTAVATTGRKKEPATGQNAGHGARERLASSDPSPDVDGRTTRSSVVRNRVCTVCRFTCKDSKEFTLHQKEEHGESKELSQQTTVRTRSSSRLNNKRACDDDNKDIETAPKKTRLFDRLKERVYGKAGRKEASSVTKHESLKLTLSTKPAPAIKDVKAADKLDVTTATAADQQPFLLTPEEGERDGVVADRGSSAEASPNSELKLGQENQEAQAASSPTTSEDNPKDSEPAETAIASSPERSHTDMMISTNGPGLAPHHNDLSTMSGASEEDEDMSEEGGGRLVIDDASGGSGGRSGGAGSGVLPTRCGNIQNRTYMCDDCDFTTTSAKQSLQHKKDAHGHDFPIYSCSLCDYATRYKQKLPRHHKLHFSASDTPTEAQIPETMLSDAETASLAVPPTPPTTTPTTPLTSLGGGGGVKRSSSEAGFPSPHHHHSHHTVLPAEVVLEEGEEEDGEEEEMMDTPTATPPPEDGVDEGLASSAAAAASVPPQKKKRKDVSPDKYFEVAEEVANTKYGCATCGNVYKWKKSLNKHWKEKHGDDPGDNQYTPPGMMVLLQANNHVQTEHRRCCQKEFLERITVKKTSSSGGEGGDVGLQCRDTPQNFLHGHYVSLGREDDDVDGEDPLSFVAAPPAIPVGPFVLGTSSQPVFPTTPTPTSGHQRQSLINSLHAPIPSSAAAGILDLTTTTCSSSSQHPHQHNNSFNMDEPDSVEDDDEASKPLDFSLQKGRGGFTSSTINPTPRSSKASPSHSSSSHFTRHPTPTSSSSALRSQGVTTEEDKEVSALNELVASSSSREGPGGAGCSKEILKCPRCQEVLKTQTAYSNHMALHLQSANKRVAKCGVCQTHFSNMEALNHHFVDNHLELINSHKEAIQKIPHGLQQTYHLLKMPLQSIPKLSSQETEDPLKCNMCEFTAKWPAELQKHAVSHSDERPFVCMVCGSTYKWKWDLVKHFEKAHACMPNPYKRRETGASSSANSAGPESGPGDAGDYEMEEGELSLVQVANKDQAAGTSSSNNNNNNKNNSNNNFMVSSGAMDSSRSFLFEQGQEEMSVENLLRTTHQASLMMSRQPNFLDSPENTLASSSASPHHPENGGERMPTFDLSSLQSLRLPTSSGGLAFVGGDFAALPDDGMGAGASGSKHGPVRNMRGRPSKEAEDPYPSLMMRTKNGGKFRPSNKAYKTVEGGELSDLKYQCTLCEYKARWPSEIMQHMKNHSSEKPYGCPNCTYRSKWKWDVVKHLKRCGSGGTIKDVIDYSQRSSARDAPPNVTVTPEGSVVQSQQGASPLPVSEDPALRSVASDGLPASVLQASSFHTTLMPSTASVATSDATRAYVNMIYQRTKAASEARSSAPLSGTSVQNGSDPPSSSSSSTSSSSYAAASSQQLEPAVTYNSIINEGQHHCLHCTFIASSVAELRRHQAVHSDEKPYTCSECSYSTKWKCDMKKHKGKYKHSSPIIDMKKGEGGQEDKACSKTCPQCTFETHSSEILQTHMKSEHAASRSSPPTSGKAKFPCRQCDFSTDELATLINHRRKHQAKREQLESCQSPSGNGNANGNGARDQDDARRKHPRKRYSCSKCDFVCLSTTELLEHQKQSHGAHTCPFCPQRFDSKGDFLDHLTTHPEFQSSEFETFFNVNIYNEEDVNNNTDNSPPAPVVAKKTKVTVVDTGSSANTIDLTGPVTATPAANAADLAGAHSGMECQWCSAVFANIVRLYQHVSHVHPVQKREQEIAEGLAPTPPANQFQPVSRAGKRPSPSYLASSKDAGKKTSAATMVAALQKRSPSPAKVNGRLSGLQLAAAANTGFSLLHTTPALAAQLGLQSQVSNPGLAQLAPNHPAACTSTSETMGLNLSTRKAENPQSSSPVLFQCTKCSFKSHNLEDYQLHLQSHTSTMAAQSVAQLRALQAVAASSKVFEPKGMRCWFCTDVFSSYPELYSHLAVTHPHRMTERPHQLQDLIAKVGKEMHLPALAAVATNARRSDSAAKTPTVVGLPSSSSSSSFSPLATTTSAAAATLAGTIQASWLHHKRMLTFRGYPLQVVGGGSAINSSLQEQIWYQCALCPMVHHSPARISQHVEQVHAASVPEKYQCGTCGHSSKMVQAIIQHHLTRHPNVQPHINVLQFQELPLPPIRQQHPAGEDHASSHPSNTPLSPLGVNVSVAVAADDGQKRGKSLSHAVIHQSPVVKTEPVSLTPPQATSSPIDSPVDCQPLDLSTEMAEDLRPAENKERGDTPSEERSSRRERAAQYKPAQESAEAQEIMEAEAATDFSKASSGGVDLTSASAANEKEEDEAQMPEQKCKHCPFTCCSSFGFRKHSSFHGLKSRYQCDLCSFSHKQLSELTQHRAVHKQHPRYSLDYTPILNETVSGADSADKASPAPQPPAPTEVLRCRHCPYKTTVQNSFALHISMHGPRCQYICDFCDWSADRLVMVLQHRNIHSSEPDFDPSPEDQVFANLEYAKVAPGEFEAKFLDSKTPEDPAHTTAASPSESGQAPPFKLSIVKKSYSCPHCPYVTGSRTPYDFHLSQHDGAGCYPCDQCSYRTNAWSRMYQHNRLHEEQPNELQSQQQRPGGSTDIAKKTPSSSSEQTATATAATAAPESGEQAVSSDNTDAVLPKGDKTSSADAEDDESVEMAEFPDREVDDEEGNCNSKASDTATTTTTIPASGAEEEVVAAAPKSTDGATTEDPEELQCERCPFRTSSRLLLSQHGKHHSGSGPVLCPCCDFSCPSTQSLLVHIQLHFPSSLVDMAALQGMLDNRHRSSGKSSPESAVGASSSSSSSGGPQAESENSTDCPQDSAEAGKESAQGKLSLPEVGERSTTLNTTTTTPSTPALTRVYACRYCDREFEGKEMMLQHERQHQG